MNYDMKRSGAYIQKLRIRNGYTQNELAALMNINRSFLSRIESGEKGCSIDLFVQFSEFFHVSLDDLILGRKSTAMQETERRERLVVDISNLIDHLTAFQKQL